MYCNRSQFQSAARKRVKMGTQNRDARCLSGPVSPAEVRSRHVACIWDSVYIISLEKPRLTVKIQEKQRETAAPRRLT